MTHEENLTALIEKYRKNREKVPLEILKTKYAAAYNQLCESIKAELKQLALQFPPWIEGRPVKEEYLLEICEIFNRLYEAGGYSKKLGRAAFKNYDAAGAIRITKEIADSFAAELEKYTATKSCLYATADCWPGGPEPVQTPKIYNDLLRQFWDDAAGGWRDPRPGELEPAITIFINNR